MGYMRSTNSPNVDFSCVHEKVFHRTFYTSYTTGSTSGAVSAILFEHWCFSTNSWHSYWYHLYSPSRWRFLKRLNLHSSPIHLHLYRGYLENTDIDLMSKWGSSLKLILYEGVKKKLTLQWTITKSVKRLIDKEWLH
jgi:hypothetical protein